MIEAGDGYEQFEFRNFEGSLRRLGDPEANLAPGLIDGLSGASPQDVATFEEVWPELEPERRRWITRTLLESAEASFHLDFTPVFSALLADEDPQVRSTAIDGLWENGEAPIARRFRSMLRADDDAGVRAHAAAALGSFVLLGELGDLGTDHLDKLVTALVDAATDEGEDVNVRRRATESAGYADRVDVRTLIEDAMVSSERDLRAAALRAMGRSADSRWSQPVLDGLEAIEPELRFEAARAAGELQLEAAVPSLVTLAMEDDREIQIEAIWALGEIGGARAKKVLEQLGADSDDVIAEAVDEALASLSLSEDGLLGMLDVRAEDDLSPGDAGWGYENAGAEWSEDDA